MIRISVSFARIAVLACATSVVPTFAASLSFNFTGIAGQGSTGNFLVFTDLNGSGITATAKAYSNNGTGGILTAAALGQYGSGLGVCNTVEQGGTGGCTATSPTWEHTVSNTNFNDFVLITFSQAVNLGTVNVAAFAGTDISYFVGALTGSIGVDPTSNAAMTGIGLGTQKTGTGSTSYSLTGTGVTSLLVGAKLGDTNDGFKIGSLAATSATSTPEPATYALMGVVLSAIGLMRRRSN